MNTKGLEGIYLERSSADDASYKPQLKAEATGNQIITAFESAISIINAGVNVVNGYGANTGKFRTGKLELVIETISDDTVCLGTKGDYPSANTVLVTIPDEEPQRSLNLEGKYDSGTEFCLVHAQWNKYLWKYDLPMQEEWYQSFRKTFAFWFEHGLREQDI